MCDFISWIEYKDDIFFLANNCLRTKEGKALRKHLGTQFQEDVKGHGAIRKYFGLPDNKGTNKECTDFSSPKNFPPAIVEAIKNGLLSAICGDVTPLLAILTQSALAEYQKIEQPALAEYQKIEQSALAEYQKIEQPAWAEYQKIRQSAWAEYQKIEQSALAEYQKIRQPAFWKLAVNPHNRVEEWR